MMVYIWDFFVKTMQWNIGNIDAKCKQQQQHWLSISIAFKYTTLMNWSQLAYAIGKSIYILQLQ